MEAEAKPFLRWVGGKARIIGKFKNFLPLQDFKGTYFEPFVGAGSVFFYTRPQSAILGDENRDLIECFRRIAERPDLVWRHLRSLMQEQSKIDYLRLREEFNRTSHSTRRAALFIYLNKTSFNGIWRVSLAGKYNVPYGGKERPSFPSFAQLRKCSEALSFAKLISGDFEISTESAKKGDFVYFDPPYIPLNDTSFFNHYTASRFGIDEHERLAIYANKLANTGVKIMVTEGDSPQVRKWYKHFHINEIDVRRFVSSEATKFLVRELVITSFPS